MFIVGLRLAAIGLYMRAHGEANSGGAARRERTRWVDLGEVGTSGGRDGRW